MTNTAVMIYDHDDFTFQHGLLDSGIGAIYIDLCHVYIKDRSWIGLAHSLTTLHLTNSQLLDVRVLDFRGLDTLWELKLSGNELCEWPVVPAGLRHLNVSLNSLTMIPARFFHDCNNLMHLDASYNQLSSIPQSMCAVSRSLRFLKLQGNRLRLRHMPERLGRMRLDEIDLSKQNVPVERDDVRIHRHVSSLMSICAVSVRNHNLIQYVQSPSLSSTVLNADYPSCANCGIYVPWGNAWGNGTVYLSDVAKSNTQAQGQEVYEIGVDLFLCASRCSQARLVHYERPGLLRGCTFY